MKEVIETTQKLEFDKSSFLIDMVRHQTGRRYIEITQNIHNQRNRGRVIQLNPLVVDQLVEVLQRYQKQLAEPRSKKSLNASKSRQQKVQDRYFKNVPMKEIGMQLGLSEQKVEAILRKRGIQIVPFKIPFWKRRRKR